MAERSMLPLQGASVLCLTFTLLLTFTFTLTLHSAAANDNCQLIPVRETIIKEMTLTHSNRNVQVSCTAEVDLHKCEGQCESRVMPSVRRHRGFRRVSGYNVVLLSQSLVPSFQPSLSLSPLCVSLSMSPRLCLSFS